MASHQVKEECKCGAKFEITTPKESMVLVLVKEWRTCHAIYHTGEKRYDSVRETPEHQER